MRESLSRLRLEDAGIVLALVFFGVAGAIPGIAPNQSSEMTGVPASHLQAVVGIGAQAVVDLGIGALLIRARHTLRANGAALRWPLALGAWTVVSLLWSADPWLTGRRALPFLLAAAFGAVLSLGLRGRRFLLLLEVAFLVLACWSAVLAVGFPAIGLDASTGHGGDWQGVFTQKNACGRAMVLALACVLARPRTNRLWRAGLLALFSAELLLSGSRGAWLIGLATVGTLGVLRLSVLFERRLRMVMLIGASTVAVAGAWGGSAAFAALAPMMGRDASLTGRTAIWHQVWLAILRHPWLGYGFSAFWQGATGPSWQAVLALRFVLFHAHNGFLEIWLELGLAGVVLFAVSSVRACILLWPELREGHYAEAAWPAVVLLLAVLYNLDENTLLSFNGLFWVLYIGALVRVEQMAAERRLVRSAVIRPAVVPLFAQPLPARALQAMLPARSGSALGDRVGPWL